MNERIKELAEQALRDATDNGFSDEVYRPVGYVTSASKAFADRFAALITQECYEWTKENGGLGSPTDYAAIKEHLGITQ